MPDALFVYGSLRSEFDNPHVRLLQEKAESMGRATVRGSIFLIGRYPGYRAEPDGVVQGEVWRLREPEATLAALDDYEGEAYSRIAVMLETPRIDAWIYLYNGAAQPDRRIASGDFLDQ